MKKSILALAVVLMVTCGATAQKLTVGPTDSVVYTGSLVTDLDAAVVHGTATNNTNTNDSILWYVTSINVPGSWEMNMCDPNLCYILYPGDNSIRAFDAPANTDVHIKFGATPYCETGTGEYEVIMWLKQDSAGSVKTVRFYATYSGACLTGIKETAVANVGVYPVPFSSSFTLTGLQGLNADAVKIFDVNGKVVYSTALVNTGDVLAVNPLLATEGVYLLTLEYAGQRIYSRSITKQ